MSRILIVSYGVVSYAVFVVAFLYAIGFVGDIAVPRSVSQGIAAPLGQALAINVALLAAFALQHSVMARPAFKRWWTRLIPPAIERSTYVLLASAVLLLIYWQWRTVPVVVWDVTSSAGRVAIWTLFWIGWAMVFAATFLINHFDLFGLRQVYLAWRGQPYTELPFQVRVLYRLVRHPLMLGFIIAFWAAPTMSGGRLLFAAVTTGYILVAIQLEERDLSVALGADYQAYRRSVPMLVPRIAVPHPATAATPPAGSATGQ
ncbi:methanethiol S-methyltransferase [Mycolicibacterium sp. XJ879]